MRLALARLLRRALGYLSPESDALRGEVEVTVVLRGRGRAWVSRSRFAATAGFRRDGSLLVCVSMRDVLAGFAEDARRCAAVEREIHKEAGDGYEAGQR